MVGSSTIPCGMPLVTFQSTESDLFNESFLCPIHLSDKDEKLTSTTGNGKF